MNKKDLIEKLVDGKHISPVLPEAIKNYLIDIDGTVCDDGMRWSDEVDFEHYFDRPSKSFYAPDLWTLPMIRQYKDSRR